MTPTLLALAELLARGLTPRQALAALAEAGGRPGAFAKQIQGASKAVGLGPALAQAGAVTRVEVDRAGGTEAVGRGGTLGWLMGRRLLARRRVRACVRTIVLPGLWAVSTILAGKGLLSIAGDSPLGYGAMFPLLVLVVGLFTAYRYAWPAALAALAPINRLTRPHLEAEFAGRLAGALRDGLDLETALDLARRVAGPLRAATPQAPVLSDALALAIAAGKGADDLPDRLDAFAAEARGRTTQILVWTTRIFAWSVVFWVGFEVLEALVKMPLGGLQGLEGVEGLDLGGDRANELDELMRELDL